jgi:hypothetical protein
LLDGPKLGREAIAVAPVARRVASAVSGELLAAALLELTLLLGRVTPRGLAQREQIQRAALGQHARLAHCLWQIAKQRSHRSRRQEWAPGILCQRACRIFQRAFQMHRARELLECSVARVEHGRIEAGQRRDAQSARRREELRLRRARPRPHDEGSHLGWAIPAHQLGQQARIIGE